MAAPPERIVRDLLEPRAYGALRPGGIELRSTHASWVFLTEREVFKVKRPVDFGFLDFRTQEARRACAEAEVRLNRRLAADVYLGVEPVWLTPDGHRIGAGPGEIVDWAVHMRRLPDDASASAMLARGALAADHLSALAATLARFFATARPTPEYGTLEALRTNAGENVTQTRPFVTEHGEIIDARTLDDIARAQDRALAAHADRFAARAAAGAIRDGHGDLRLEHVYFLDAGAPAVVIDCIEFNERFRCGDVASELAFLAMELERGAAPRPRVGLRGPRRRGDSTTSTSTASWTSTSATGPGCAPRSPGSSRPTPASPPISAARRPRRPTAASRWSARPARGRWCRPRWWRWAGSSARARARWRGGSGRALAAPVIGSDRTRKALAGLAADAPGSEALYTAERKDATYAEVLRRADVVLASGRTAIVDATFTEPRWRAQAAALARARGATFAFVEARCPDWDVLAQRIAARRRGPSESDADEALLAEVRRRAPEPRVTDDAGTLVVDTRVAPAAAARLALDLLAGAGVGVIPPHENADLRG